MKNVVLNEPGKVRCLVEYKRGDEELNLYFDNLIRQVPVTDSVPIPLPVGEEYALMTMQSMHPDLGALVAKAGLNIVKNRFLEGHKEKHLVDMRKWSPEQREAFNQYIDRFVYEIECLDVNKIKVVYRWKKEDGHESKA